MSDPTLSDDQLPVPVAGDLVGGQIADSGPVWADGQPHVIRWKNHTGIDLRIRKTYVWVGIDETVTCDAYNVLTRESDGTVLAVIQFDHYAEPNYPGGVQFNWDNPGLLLKAADHLLFTYYAAPSDGTQDKHQQEHVAYVWVEPANTVRG
jgi:hypothetical protein